MEIKYKDLVINQDFKSCYLNSKEIPLTKIEYNLILFFINNKGKVFNRNEIIQNVWNKKVSLRTVDATISRLKKKLGVIGDNINTRFGFGYGLKE